MKIFLDTASIHEVSLWKQTGLIDGVTTNPSHLAKQGQDPKKVIMELCRLLPDGEISVEVTEHDPEKVYQQAKVIAALAENIVVKVPCHKDYYQIIDRLVHEDVPLNITLVFSLIQSAFMCKLGVAYISPFIGRLDDIDVATRELLLEIRTMIDEYGFTTQLLAASVRTVGDFHAAIMSGADAITVPSDLLQKTTSHVLTKEGMAKFDADWEKLGIKQFP